MNKIYISIFLLCLGTAGVYAQNNTVSSGGVASGSGGSSTYSIGQLDYVPASGSGGSATLGLQRPLEIVVVSGVKETAVELTASVFPNPSSDFVNLTITGAEIKFMSFELSDVIGKQLVQRKLTSATSTIQLKEFAAGTYFIKVNNNGTAIKTFKIIKK